MEKITHSPAPEKIKELAEKFIAKMDFPTAIRKLIEGKKIYKLEWAEKDYYAVVLSGILELHKPDGKYYQWILTDGDLHGTDWVVID